MGCAKGPTTWTARSRLQLGNASKDDFRGLGEPRLALTEANYSPPMAISSIGSRRGDTKIDEAVSGHSWITAKYEEIMTRNVRLWTKGRRSFARAGGLPAPDRCRMLGSCFGFHGGNSRVSLLDFAPIGQKKPLRCGTGRAKKSCERSEPSRRFGDGSNDDDGGKADGEEEDCFAGVVHGFGWRGHAAGGKLSSADIVGAGGETNREELRWNYGEVGSWVPHENPSFPGLGLSSGWFTGWTVKRGRFHASCRIARWSDRRHRPAWRSHLL